MMELNRSKSVFWVLVLVSVFCIVSAFLLGLKKQKAVRTSQDIEIMLQEEQSEFERLKSINEKLKEKLSERLKNIKEYKQLNESLQNGLISEQRRNKTLSGEIEKLKRLNEKLLKSKKSPPKPLEPKAIEEPTESKDAVGPSDTKYNFSPSRKK